MGLVQGISELFPVSSLGHGVLLPALLGWHNLVNSQTQSESFFLVFLVGLHVGTAVGLFVFYRRTWFALFRGLFRQVATTRERGLRSLWQFKDPSMDKNYRLLFILAAATIPVGIAGVLLDHKLRELFAKPLAAAIFLSINGLILLAGERLLRSRGRHARYAKLDTVAPLSAVAMGSSQILALLAGISRSGVTMVAGLMGGLDHEESANFSFLLATPVILAAGLYKLPKLLGPLGQGVRMQSLVGALFAMVAAYVAVRFLTKWFTTRTLVPFGIYSLVAGLLCVIRFA
ncbi:MAG: undecaprenyl-diphosphate phosphatase [Acidimicrobiales bacterium]